LSGQIWGESISSVKLKDVDSLNDQVFGSVSPGQRCDLFRSANGFLKVEKAALNGAQEVCLFDLDNILNPPRTTLQLRVNTTHMCYQSRHKPVDKRLSLAEALVAEAECPAQHAP